MKSQSLLVSVVVVLLFIALGYMYWQKRHPPASAAFVAPIVALRYNLPAPDPSAGGRLVIDTEGRPSPALIGLKVSATIAITDAEEPARSKIAGAFMPYRGTISEISGSSVTLSPAPPIFAGSGGRFSVAVSSGGLAAYLPLALPRVSRGKPPPPSGEEEPSSSGRPA